jgi:hypothetical protein
MAMCYSISTLVRALVHRARWLGSPCKLCTCAYVGPCSPLGCVFSGLFRVCVCPALGVGVVLPVLLGADKTCVYVICILVSWDSYLLPICVWLVVILLTFLKCGFPCWVVPRCLYGTVGNPYHWVTGCTWIFLLIVTTKHSVLKSHYGTTAVCLCRGNCCRFSSCCW